VPYNIGKLARKHKEVTLLFMDIVGFTEFSKVITAYDNMKSVVAANILELNEEANVECKACQTMPYCSFCC